MRKVIGATLYALIVVGVCFTLPTPAAKASCDAYCLLENCQSGPGGIHYGWTRASGDLFVTLTTPQHCVFPDNLYVSCTERNYGCASASTEGTYKVEGDAVLVYDHKNHLQRTVNASEFNARHQKELAASIRTCSGRYR